MEKVQQKMENLLDVKPEHAMDLQHEDSINMIINQYFSFECVRRCVILQYKRHRALGFLYLYLFSLQLIYKVSVLIIYET